MQTWRITINFEDDLLRREIQIKDNQNKTYELSKAKRELIREYKKKHKGVISNIEIYIKRLR